MAGHYRIPGKEWRDSAFIYRLISRTVQDKGTAQGYETHFFFVPLFRLSFTLN
jgi:hypothetical protein